MAMAGRRPIPGPVLLPLSCTDLFFSTDSVSLLSLVALYVGTDNMQMEHRATAIIYGSYHAVRDLMTVCAVCMVCRVYSRASALLEIASTDKHRILVLCPILSGHLDKFIRVREDDDRVQLLKEICKDGCKQWRDNYAGFLKTCSFYSRT